MEDYSYNNLPQQGSPHHFDLPAEDLAALNMAASVFPEKTSEDHAREILNRSAPQVALGLVRLATSAGNDRVRLDAAKYILEKTAYRQEASGTTNDPLTELLGSVVKDAEDYANQG